MSKEKLFSQARKSGKSAQQSNILAARIIAETVRSTLGPKGMDKILLDEQNNVTITNDGATIVNQLASDHPVARMITEIAMNQEEQVGDGTTTAVLLAGELLSRAEALLDQKIHPTLINKGYQLASDHAVAHLRKIAKKVDFNEEIIAHLAKTAMTGKGAESASPILVPLLVKAATTVESLDISVMTQPGIGVDKSDFISGLMVSKGRANAQMPETISEPKIALLSCAIEASRGASASVSIQTPEQLEAFMEREEAALKVMVDTIKASGATVVCTNKGIDEIAQQHFAQAGIYAMRRVPTKELNLLAKNTGAQLCGVVSDVTSSSLGTCGEVSSKIIMDVPYTIFSGIATHGTFLITGATPQVADEMARALEDALGDIRAFKESGLIVGGAGSIDMQLSVAVRALASTVQGKEQLAIDAFAQALEIVPLTLAENAGLDQIDILTALRADPSKGINVNTGELEDPFASGIIEPLGIKEHALLAATEVSVMILRIDDIIFTGNLDEAPLEKPQG